MKVIKRDGHMVEWCPEKIEMAIEKANCRSRRRRSGF